MTVIVILAKVALYCLKHNTKKARHDNHYSFVPRSKAPALPRLPPAEHTPAICRLPLLEHRISAGFPSPADEYIEKALDLNNYLVRNKAATFVFWVMGDSMIGANIQDGDMLVVDRSI